MADFHFVEDYERMVADLVARYPLDEAMGRAVGSDISGDFEAAGVLQRSVLGYAGLRDGQRLIDLGCGSGRLAVALARTLQVDYIGIDIVQALLDYAASKSPPGYRFVLHRKLSVPVPDASADMVCAFSLFTHLLHTETYLYLEDIFRVLRPGGRLLFSFLEFANIDHWLVFGLTVEAQRHNTVPHLNQFIERNAIDLWCAKLGFVREAFVDGTAAPWRNAPPLWQSLAILRKP